MMLAGHMPHLIGPSGARIVPPPRCIRRDTPLDIVPGVTIGRLTVRAIVYVQERTRRWRSATCRCECGALRTLRIIVLRKLGERASCGCIGREYTSARMSAYHRARRAKG